MIYDFFCKDKYIQKEELHVIIMQLKKVKETITHKALMPADTNIRS
jgi:hypothetical protein